MVVVTKRMAYKSLVETGAAQIISLSLERNIEETAETMQEKISIENMKKQLNNPAEPLSLNEINLRFVPASSLTILIRSARAGERSSTQLNGNGMV